MVLIGEANQADTVPVDPRRRCKRKNVPFPEPSHLNAHLRAEDDV